MTTEGVVLRRRTMPRGDVLATLVSASGKFKVVAHNAAKGSRGRVLSLFHHVSVTGVKPQGRDILTVREVSLEGALPHLADPVRFAAASLLCEVADALIQEGETPSRWSQHAFELLASGLRGCNSSARPDQVAWVICWKLLIHAGFPQRFPQGDEPRTGVLANATTYAMLEAVHQQSVRSVLEQPWPDDEGQWRMWRALRLQVERQCGQLQSWEVLWPMLELELGEPLKRGGKVPAQAQPSTGPQVGQDPDDRASDERLSGAPGSEHAPLPSASPEEDEGAPF